MAFDLLKRVASSALGAVGGAASSAINYLTKNAPEVIDQHLQNNPSTFLFSRRGQEGMANVGRKMQQTPDTTLNTDRLSPFIKPIVKPIVDKVLSPDEQKVTGLLTGIPGEMIRSLGKTTERMNTSKGRGESLQGAKKIPGQVWNKDLGGLLENPAVEDALNISTLFDLGAGTVIKAGTKKATKEVVEAGVKDVTKVALEQEKKEGLRTIFKKAKKKGAPTVMEKTQQLFKKNVQPTVQAAKINLEQKAEALKGVGQQVTDAAQEAGEILEPVKTKTGQLFQKGTDIARKWINTREGYTNWRAGDIKKNSLLTQFDNEGIEAMIDLQSGANPGRYTAVKEFTDGLFELEKKAGIIKPDQYRKNYLPQLWDNTPEEILQAFNGAKNVGGTPGFSKSRMFEDIKTGIDAGLKPRFDNISDLLTSRYTSAQRALADNDLVEQLVKSGNGKTLDKAPRGWQVTNLKYQGKPLAVDADTAKMIQNYTSEGSPLLEKTAEFVSNAKQTILSAGIPRTGWNFHTGVNVPVRAAAARKNPFGAIVDSAIWNSNPKSALHYIEKVVPKDITDGLLKEGLNISRSAEAGGYAFKPRAGTSAISKGRTWMDKMFSEVAFDQVLPAHKLKVGWETYEKAIKNGLSPDDAYRLGAETANEVFGGINPAEFARSKDVQNVFRTLALAPDWLESNVRIGGKLGSLVNPKNWTNPKYAPYRRFARNAAGMYTTFAFTNKALSGHWPWENGPGQEFNLATGSFDERGRERVVPAFGTAFDFIRIPLQMVTGAMDEGAKGLARPIRNRLSPPASALASLFITGEDYRGRPIDDAGDVAGQIASAVGVPSQVTNTLSFLRGDSTGEELVAGLLEAPLRYRGGANTPEKRQTAELLKEGGATNEDIGAAFDYGGGSAQKEEGGGFFSGLFGGDKSYKTLGATADGKPITFKNKKEKEAFEDSIDNALASGAEDLPESAIVTRFFDGKTYDKSARKGQQEILDSMLDVADDEFLTPGQKSAIANAAKIDTADLQYYRTASLDQDDRLEGLLEYATTADPENRGEFMENLILGKKQVGGKSMFSTSMYDRLYDEGLISKEEKALITAVKYDPVFNKFYMDRDYKGGGGGGMTASKVSSYIKSVNAIFKNPIKSSKTTGIDKQVAQILESEGKQAPKLTFKKAPKTGGGSTSRWFTQY